MEKIAVLIPIEPNNHILPFKYLKLLLFLLSIFSRSYIYLSIHAVTFHLILFVKTE